MRAKRFVMASMISGLLCSTALGADKSILVASPGKDAIFDMNDRLVSSGGKYILLQQASDGNLVIYKSDCVGGSKCAVWASHVYDKPGQYFLAMKDDGNLVTYRGTGPADKRGVVWESKSGGEKDSYFMVLQDDQNLVIYRGTSPADNQGAVWSSKSGIMKEPTVLSYARIKLGEMELPPCSTMEAHQLFKAKLKTGRQFTYAYLYIDQQAFNKSKKDVEECAHMATDAVGIGSIFTNTASALPVFKASLGTCLAERKVDRLVIQSAHLNAESQCFY
ncbi:MAG: hypothetical protein PHE55_01310 [Methylococcaceae bacterium]|nr:hypothetical protein [Methylococcaceae bacterium]